MKNYLKITFFLLLCVFLSIASANAFPLPAADFSGNFTFDPSSSSVLSSNVSVTNVAYLDGTYANSSAVDPVIGSLIGTSFSGWNFDPTSLKLTIDSGATNNFTIGNFFSGMLYDYSVKSPTPDLYLISARILNEQYNAQGSNFIDQFEAVNSNFDYAQLISFNLLLGNTSGDTLLVNSQGKVAPVPEPSTMLLLGTGLMAMAGFGRKKLKKS